MVHNPDTVKKASLVALAGLVVLFIGSIVYYKERLLFADSAYIVYNILKVDRLFIEEHRLGSFITQIVPLVAGKLHLPVDIALKGYTLSFNFFYLLVGCIVYRCRQYGLVVLMALGFTLLISDSYFWTNNEIFQAIGWMFLFYGIFLRMGQLKLPVYLILPVFVVLATLTIYTHFVVMLPMSFLWAYFWISKDNWYWDIKTSLLFTGCLVAIVGSKFLVVESTSYDAQHLHSVTHFSIPDIFNALTSNNVLKFCFRLLTRYWVALIMIVAGGIALLKHKNKWLLVCTLIVTGGYFAVMGLAYPADFNPPYFFHLESEWASFGVIAATPFVYLVLPKMQHRVAIMAIAAALCVRFLYLNASAEKFVWRTHFKQEVLAKMKEKNITKLAIYKTDSLIFKNILEWAIPEESILLGCLDHDSMQRSFVMINKLDSGLISDLLVPDHVFFYSRMPMPLHHTNDYFKQDSSRPYSIMTYEELLK